MYVAMNRFRIHLGQEAAFEEVWRNRRSHLDTVPGFKTFHLMRGPRRPDHTLYASHSAWVSEDSFLDWTRSEAFRVAHRDAGSAGDLYLGHPEFEGFTAVIGQSTRNDNKSDPS